MRICNITKLIVFGVLFLLLGVVLPSIVVAEDEEVNGSESEDNIILFVEEGCPHCSKVENFLSENSLEEKIETVDIRADPANAALYTQMCEDAGIALEDRGFPLLFDGEEHFSGSYEIITHLGEKFGVEVGDYLNENNGEDGEEDLNERSTRIVLIILGFGVFISVAFLALHSKRKR